MSDSKVNIKVIFDGVAQGAMSATRRLSSEIKQLGAESKRANAALAGIGRGMMKGVESGAMFGVGAMVDYNQFVAPMVKAAETYARKQLRERQLPLQQGQVKEEVILKSGLKAVADLVTIKQAKSDVANFYVY